MPNHRSLKEEKEVFCSHLLAIVSAETNRLCYYVSMSQNLKNGALADTH